MRMVMVEHDDDDEWMIYHNADNPEGDVTRICALRQERITTDDIRKWLEEHDLRATYECDLG